MTRQPEKTQLTEDELALYLRLQAKVGYRQTGKVVFESFFPILPMVPYELAVVRKIDGLDHVLLWYREDEHYIGWHMPGSYLRFGESDRQVIERTLSKEVGLTLVSAEFICHFNTPPETGWVPNHQIAQFFLCETSGEPTTEEFFLIDALPEKILDFHRIYINHLHAYLLCKKSREV
ncbi:MAG: hypothetical protein AAB723_02470 [Patescibacteria group bacterium]